LFFWSLVFGGFGGLVLVHGRRLKWGVLFAGEVGVGAWAALKKVFCLPGRWVLGRGHRLPLVETRG